MNAPLRGPQDTRFYPVVHVTQTGSTNNDVATEARRGASEGFTLVADYQTEGRGRLERRWLASQGDSLLLSTLLKPGVELVPVVPLLAGLAVQQAVQRLLPDVDPALIGLKWPNDVLVLDSRKPKLAGILAESTIVGSVASVVVGIGLNIKFSVEPPDEIAERAVSLAQLGSAQISNQEALTAVLSSLEHWLAAAEESGPEFIVTAYRARCSTVGEDITFTDPAGETLQGRVTGISSSGGLRVDADSGQHTIHSGDIWHLGLTT